MTDKFDNLITQIFEEQVQSSTPAADAASQMVTSQGDKNAILKLKNIQNKNKQITKDALQKAEKEVENNKKYVKSVSTG